MNKRLRTAIDNALDDVTFTPQMEARLFKRTVDNKGMSKRAAALVAVLIVMALATGIAFATGVAQTLFRSMSGVLTSDNVDYERLDALANPPTEPPTARFALEQSYLDDHLLVLGYSFDNAVTGIDHSFDRSSPIFDEAKASESMLNTLRSMLPAEDYAAFRERLANDGRAGVYWRTTYIGDSVYLRSDSATASDADALLDIENDVYTQDGNITRRYVELAREGGFKSVSAANVRLSQVYGTRWYYEENGQAYYGVSLEREPIYLEIPKSADGETAHVAEVIYDDYTTRIEIVKTPVQARVTLRLTVREAWIQARQTLAGRKAFTAEDPDIIRWYALVGPDGLDEGWDSHEETLEDGYLYIGACALPSDGQTLTFRPVYTVTGERPEEDITVKLY